MNYIDKILSNLSDTNEIVRLFFIEPVLEEVVEKYSDKNLEYVAKKILDLLLNIKIEKIIEIIENNKRNIKKIDSKNIPQFSNINNIDMVLNIVASNEIIKYKDIGYFFNKDADKIAQQKYGENHYKICSQIGLTSMTKPYRISFIGKEYCKYSTEEKEELKTKLMLKIPIIQQIIVNSKNNKIKIMDILREHLAEATAIRRRSNIKVIINRIVDLLEIEYKEVINNNLDWK